MLSKYKYYYFIILVILIPQFVHSEEIFNKKNAFSLDIFLNYASKSDYYDRVGKKIMQYYDSTAIKHDSYIVFENKIYTFGVNIKYSIFDDMNVYLKIPLEYQSLTESYQIDSTGMEPRDSITGGKFIRPTLSLFKPAYYGIGANYKLFSGKFFGSSNLEFRIPSGFHNGILNDPDYPYLSDGAFEILAGFDMGYHFNTSGLDLGVTYNYRAEELVDQLLINAEGYVSTVKDTKLYARFNVIQSLKSFSNSYQYDPHKFVTQTPLQEDKISIQFGLFLKTSKTFNLDMSYDLVLWGQNTWGGGKLLLNANMLINN